jgi:hypothetical protein
MCTLPSPLNLSPNPIGYTRGLARFSFQYRARESTDKVLAPRFSEGANLVGTLLWGAPGPLWRAPHRYAARPRWQGMW